MELFASLIIIAIFIGVVLFIKDPQIFKKAKDFFKKD